MLVSGFMQLCRRSAGLARSGTRVSDSAASSRVDRGNVLRPGAAHFLELRYRRASPARLTWIKRRKFFIIRSLHARPRGDFPAPRYGIDAGVGCRAL